MNETVEVKTCDLEGPTLDWAVAVIEGYDLMKHPFRRAYIPNFGYCDYSPSTNWTFGGPLITKFLIEFRVEHERTICSYLCDANGMYISDGSYGDTYLIAACRAIVTDKLGETVSVPAELIK
ncbi:phage protein NinX family protein [Pseudomonas aeruginosa]|uniref:phage protein NinX family protein n=1 Tax=Pseudomonas aeruginosa TaxID=287 RepID=UPI00094168DA|nr:phage protein NinX family protein [Pseudomonas aeruginosa]